MPELIKEYKDAKKDYAAMVEEPTTMGGRFKFEDAWVTELKEACESVLDLVGFSATVVQTIAADVVMKHTDEDEKGEAWVPSLKWCYWFMRKHLKLRLINEAVAKVSTDSGDAVARIGELRL